MIIHTKVLLYFLDPAKIKGKLAAIDAAGRDFYKPDSASFFASEKVIELEWLLAGVLEDDAIRSKLVASVSAIEGCTYAIQNQLERYARLNCQDIYIRYFRQPGIIICADP